MVGKAGDDEKAAQGLGFPGFATKNTTRVGGADAVANAAGVAQAVYTARSRDTRPAAVTRLGTIVELWNYVPERG